MFFEFFKGVSEIVNNFTVNKKGNPARTISDRVGKSDN